jgi:hypothetical protein
MTTVWIYVDTNKEVGDVDHLKAFATAELADILFDTLIVIGPRLCSPPNDSRGARPCKSESSFAFYSSPCSSSSIPFLPRRCASLQMAWT